MAALMAIGDDHHLAGARTRARACPSASSSAKQRVVSWLATRAHWPRWMRATGAWFIGAIAGPIVDFFGRYGLGLGLLIFAFISTYRLTDYVMGTMTNPFYIDMGFTLKRDRRASSKFFGWPATLVGAVVGGAHRREARTHQGRCCSAACLIIISNVFYADLRRLRLPRAA